MRPLKVYLAAPYALKELIKVRADQLRLSGLIVTSSWLEEPHDSTVGPQDLSRYQNQVYASQDIQDVRDADLMVFQPDETKKIIRAGRHVEFGIAIGLGFTRPYPIFVIGHDHENIFHYLEQVYHFSSWDRVVDRLLKIEVVE